MLRSLPLFLTLSIRSRLVCNTSELQSIKSHNHETNTRQQRPCSPHPALGRPRHGVLAVPLALSRRSQPLNPGGIAVQGDEGVRPRLPGLERQHRPARGIRLRLAVTKRVLLPR